MNSPFIYIASLRRTGSTVLSEALSRLPHAFIFREPGLAQGSFAVKAADRGLFQRHGVDLKQFADSLKSGSGASGAIRAFCDRLLPELYGVVRQVGVKEIFHEGWQAYRETFPNMKVLLTGRDPRDIFLSLADRVQQSGTKRWEGDFTPESVAADLNREFAQQQEIRSSCDCLEVRYETFCTDPALFERIKSFCESPIPSIGDVGAFNRSNPKRGGEYELHRDEITGQRIERWRAEPDPALNAAARRMVELMPEYCAHWGYE